MTSLPTIPVPTARHINALIGQVAGAYHPLIWLVAESAEDTSAVLARAALQHKVSVVEVGRQLAEGLAPLTGPQRRRQVAPILEAIASSSQDAPVFLDHIEVLFEPALAISVARQMEALSRQFRALIVAWPGRIAGKELYYGSPGHPEHQTHTIGSYPVVKLDGDLNLSDS